VARSGSPRSHRPGSGCGPVGRADQGATYALSKCDRCAVKDPYAGRFLVWLFRDGNRAPLMRLAEYRDSCGPRPTPPAIAPGKGRQRMSCLGQTRPFFDVCSMSGLTSQPDLCAASPKVSRVCQERSSSQVSLSSPAWAFPSLAASDVVDGDSRFTDHPVCKIDA